MYTTKVLFKQFTIVWIKYISAFHCFFTIDDDYNIQKFTMRLINMTLLEYLSDIETGL